MQGFISSTGNKGAWSLVKSTEADKEKKRRINFYIYLLITKVQVNCGRNEFYGKKHSKQ